MLSAAKSPAVTLNEVRATAIKRLASTNQLTTNYYEQQALIFASLYLPIAEQRRYIIHSFLGKKNELFSTDRESVYAN